MPCFSFQLWDVLLVRNPASQISLRLYPGHTWRRLLLFVPEPCHCAGLAFPQLMLLSSAQIILLGALLCTQFVSEALYGATTLNLLVFHFFVGKRVVGTVALLMATSQDIRNAQHDIINLLPEQTSYFRIVDSKLGILISRTSSDVLHLLQEPFSVRNLSCAFVFCLFVSPLDLIHLHFITRSSLAILF